MESRESPLQYDFGSNELNWVTRIIGPSMRHSTEHRWFDIRLLAWLAYQEESVSQYVADTTPFPSRLDQRWWTPRKALATDSLLHQDVSEGKEVSSKFAVPDPRHPVVQVMPWPGRRCLQEGTARRPHCLCGNGPSPGMLVWWSYKKLEWYFADRCSPLASRVHMTSAMARYILGHQQHSSKNGGIDDSRRHVSNPSRQLWTEDSQFSLANE